MALSNLSEASLVDLWKTKCDSLRAFEPSAFYKDILASEPIESYYYRGIQATDYIYISLEDTNEAEVTLGLVSVSYSSSMFDEYKNPRLRDHFGKFSGIVVFDKGTKAYILPEGNKELVYDYEKEALTFGRFKIKKLKTKHKIPSPEEPSGYYEVDLFYATPIEQSMDLAQEVQIEESNRIIKKYSDENILRMYQNYIIAKANELDAKYIVVPDEASKILIIDDNFLDTWLCIAYRWTFNERYFYNLAEYFNINTFLEDIKREHKKYPKKIIFKDRYFQRVEALKALPEDIKIIFKDCEIGTLDICKESKYFIQTKNSIVLNNRSKANE